MLVFFNWNYFPGDDVVFFLRSSVQIFEIFYESFLAFDAIIDHTFSFSSYQITRTFDMSTYGVIPGPEQWKNSLCKGEGGKNGFILILRCREFVSAVHRSFDDATNCLITINTRFALYRGCGKTNT